MVPDPETASPLPEAAHVLARLAARYGRVAVVSGRPASFLARHLVVAGTARVPDLVGLYGLEAVAADGEVVVAPGAEPWRSAVAEAADRAEATAPAGARVERKGLTVTLHWREEPGAESWAVSSADRLGAELGLAVHPAKMSVELRPPIAVDKGTAVTTLAQGFGAVAFLGDDLGDVPAFTALEELARTGVRIVRVGVRSEESPSQLLDRADLVVEGPEGALKLLGALVPDAAGSRG